MTEKDIIVRKRGANDSLMEDSISDSRELSLNSFGREAKAPRFRRRKGPGSGRSRGQTMASLDPAAAHFPYHSCGHCPVDTHCFCDSKTFPIHDPFDATGSRELRPGDASGVKRHWRSASDQGLGSLAGDLLGVKSSSDLFVGILQSRTVQDDLINKFDLKKVYSAREMEDARESLNNRTDLTSDRKTGIISFQVTDSSPKRAAAMAGEYVNELNWVVTQLNTSSGSIGKEYL